MSPSDLIVWARHVSLYVKFAPTMLDAQSSCLRP